MQCYEILNLLSARVGYRPPEYCCRRLPWWLNPKLYILARRVAIMYRYLYLRSLRNDKHSQQVGGARISGNGFWRQELVISTNLIDFWMR